MIFIFLTVVGFILLIIAVRLFVKKSRLKEIVESNILEFPLKFNIHKPGMYAISFVGLTPDFNVKNLNLILSSPESTNLILHEYSLKPTFLRKRKRCFSQWYFSVGKNGIYELRFENLEEFMLKHPILKSEKILSNRKFQTENLDILIKEGMKNKEYFLMILAAVFGFNMFSLGIIMGLNRHLFQI
ncbi:hypothetical protein [uncultured Aquimarina sp.]|uniref:hypothetical protein n=1 Tax=uncultured Aquimarina sp. TaxID=575652 RepID=UPI002637DDB8|nr:hypothetical protein [uncultured Aquimarina sp.]